MMKPSKIVFFISTSFLVAVIALVWLTAVRETFRKDVVLEYEAFQASTSLMDEYRRDGALVPPQDEKNILGFGLYSFDGSSLQRFGSAPSTITVPENLFPTSSGQRPNGLPGGIYSKLSSGRKSIQLLRFAGMMNSFRGMEQGQMMGSGMGQGMGFGQGFGRRGQGQQAPAPADPGRGGEAFAPTIQGAPYFTWIEYNAAGYLRERMLWLAMASLVTLVLITLYVILLLMFRHNEELRIRQAETRELVQLGEAARTLVHQIKNPLGIMRVQTARIRRLGSSQEERSEEQLLDASRVLDGEIVRLAGLADRIREFLKAGEGKPQVLDLVAFLDEYAKRYSGGLPDGCRMVADLPRFPGGARVLIDRDRLTLALDNIVNNGIEAATSRAEGDKFVAIRLGERGQTWTIAVEDSGPGIPLESRDRLFEPFYTTKEKGSGIGLALAKRIVESAGGTIDLESEPGAGTVFTISLQKVSAPG